MRFSWRGRERPPSGRLHRLQTRTRRNLRWTWRHPTRHPTHRNRRLWADTRVATVYHLRNRRHLHCLHKAADLKNIPPVHPIRPSVGSGSNVSRLSWCNRHTHALDKICFPSTRNRHYLHDSQSSVQTDSSCASVPTANQSENPWIAAASHSPNNCASGYDNVINEINNDLRNIHRETAKQLWACCTALLPP